jgi:YHS domain-containing protein
MPRDLVCQQDVAGEGNRYFTDYGGEMYYFCSPECKRKFDDHPDHYVRERAKNELGL